MKTCPYCFKTDLDDRASKCPHCAEWLESGPRKDRGFEELRSDLQNELRADRRDYQEYMKSLFNRVQIAASIILVLVIAASAWFGFRTDRGIEEIKNEIIGRISARIETEFQADTTRMLIHQKIDDYVRENIQPIIDKKAKEATAAIAERIAETFGDIEEMRIAAEKRFTGIERIANISSAAILQAAEAPVEERLALPVDLVLAEKSSVDEIRVLMKQQPTALGFHFHRDYNGPAIWKYFDSLIRLPTFRYVVVDSEDGLFGVYDAPVLVAALNPVNARELTKSYPLISDELPTQERVADWTQFADWLRDGSSDAQQKLAALPGFVPVAQAVALGAEKLEVLDSMEEANGANWLPVVNPGGHLIGMVERSHLTASLVLDIASLVESSR